MYRARSSALSACYRLVLLFWFSLSLSLCLSHLFPILPGPHRLLLVVPATSTATAVIVVILLLPSDTNTGVAARSHQGHYQPESQPAAAAAPSCSSAVIAWWCYTRRLVGGAFECNCCLTRVAHFQYSSHLYWVWIAFYVPPSPLVPLTPK